MKNTDQFKVKRKETKPTDEDEKDQKDQREKGEKREKEKWQKKGKICEVKTCRIGLERDPETW